MSEQKGICNCVGVVHAGPCPKPMKEATKLARIENGFIFIGKSRFIVDDREEVLDQVNGEIDSLLQSERAKVWEEAAKIMDEQNHLEDCGEDGDCLNDCPITFGKFFRARAREEEKS